MFYKLLILVFISFNFLYANNIIVGSGVLKKEMKTIKDINSIKIKCPIDVSINKSLDEKYIIHADDNIIDMIDISISKSSLEFECNKSFNTKNKIVLELFLSKIKEVKLDGSINLELKNLDEDKFNLDVNGSINIKSGKSKVKSFFLESEGSYSLELDNMITNNSNLNLKGTGNINLYVENYLVLKSEAVSNIYLKGNPKIEKQINFMTNIERLK